jgi:hypothetical protein
MIKVMIGTSTNGGTLIRLSDKAILGEDNIQVGPSIIKLLQTAGVNINSDIQTLLNRISESDITTYTDYLCLQNYLHRYGIGILAIDAIQEDGEEDDSSLSVVMVNTNGGSNVKPAVIYHTNINDVDMLQIFQDTCSRYNIYPDSLYPDAPLKLKLDSAIQLSKIGGISYQNDKDDIATILARLGFKVYFITH